MNRNAVFLAIIALAFALGAVGFLLMDKPLGSQDAEVEPFEKADPPAKEAPPRREAAPEAQPEPAVEKDVSAEELSGIHGVVTDAVTGAPVAGARLWLHYDEFETISDSNGTYRFREDLLAERPADFIYVDAPGYARAEVTLLRETEMPLEIRLSQGAIIQGRLVDASSGEPIEGLKVLAFDPDSVEQPLALTRFDGPTDPQAVSDADGGYVIDYLSEGLYFVGVQTWESPFIFSPADALTVEVKAGEIGAADFSLERGAAVSGRIVDESGRPLEGAMIAEQYSPFKTDIFEAHFDPNSMYGKLTTSDEAGNFIIEGLEPDRSLRLNVTLEGFATFPTGEILPTVARTTVLPDIVLTKGQRVAGVVLDASGEPSVGRYVLLQMADLSPRHVETDEDGLFEFLNVPTGEGVVQIVSFHTAMASVNSDRGPGVQNVFVENGRDISDIVLEDTAETDTTDTSITGTVLDANGAPVASAYVEAHPSIAIDAFSDIDQADVNGRFTLDTQGLSATIKASHEGLVAIMKNVSPGSDVKLVLGAGASIAGAVVTGRGEPCEDCDASIEEMKDGQPHNPALALTSATIYKMTTVSGVGEQMEEDGSFEFEGLAAGTYVVNVSSRRDGHASSDPITLATGEQRTGVRIALAPGAVVRGMIRGPDGQQLKGATIALMPAGGDDAGFGSMMNVMGSMGLGSGPRTTSRESGAFEIENIKPGDYFLSGSYPGLARTSSEIMRLEAGDVVDGIDLAMMSGGRVSGTLVTPGGVAPNAMLTLVGENGVFTVMTDSNGNFEIENIPPGEYISTHVDMTSMMGGDMSGMNQRPQLVEVADGQETVIDFSPPAGAVTVSGVVQGATGSMTTFSLRREGGPDPMAFNPMEMDMAAAIRAAAYQVGQGFVSPDGTFSLEGVPPGNYLLDVVSMDFDISQGIAAMENMDMTNIPMQSIPITVNEGNTHFVVNFNPEAPAQP